MPEAKILGAKVPLEVIDRLRFESVRSRIPIHTIVTAALETYLPKSIRIVVGKEKA